jgi:hypothetical protein
VPGDLVTLKAFGRVPATGAQSLGPSGWAVGFSNTDNSIGVGSESSSNIKCSQVNEVSPTSEVLVIELNNDAGADLQGWMWDVLELDLEAKFRPQHVFYQLLDDGVVVSGQDKVELPICGDPTADCGPDSTDSDNWRVTIPQPIAGAYPSLLFDEIRIWPETDGGVVGNGSIDLKGGSDGTAPFCLIETVDGSCTEYGLADDVNEADPGSVTDSLFHLVQPAEGTFCPGQTITEPTGTGTASVTYLEYRGTGDGCKFYALDYDRNTTTNERTLIFLTSGGTTTNATFDVHVAAWDPEPAANPIPLSLTDPAGADADPTGEWCEGTFADPAMPTDGNGNFVESWCAYELLAQTYGPDGDGTTSPDWVPGYDGQLIKVTEKWLLVGDATIQRR